MKLYYVVDGPPSMAVRLALKVLDVPHEAISVNYMAGEHMTEEYAKKNPQKEIPVIDDDGFYLSESNAILQYICDKYRPDSPLYPKDPQTRAIVNHRLCFNLSTYYKYINEYSMDPVFFDYERTPLGLKKTHIALTSFETYLERLGTKYVAANHLTIADLSFVTSTMLLEAIDFNMSNYPMISKWYATFKEEYPELWAIAAVEMNDLKIFAKNPPDLSHLSHPIHSFRNKKQ